MTIKRKMKKQTANKLLCLLLAVLLLAGQVLPALALNQEGGTITIATAEDLKELAVQCTLDSWSQGKTVVLTDDINLSGSATPSPACPSRAAATPGGCSAMCSRGPWSRT